MDITTGTTLKIIFPRGMHKADFAKCLSMARKIGRYDGQAWTVTITGPHAAACVTEMADRGATVTEA